VNFRDFVVFRKHVLAERPDVLNLAENDLAQTLRHLRVTPHANDSSHRTHRCHLAEQWLAVFGLPAEWRGRALISHGVRHSLALLFAGWARQGKTALLPADIYPVYGQLATAAGLPYANFETIRTIEAGELQEADILLVANPLKPRGNMLGASEVSALKGWLAVDPSRRLVIDAVYTFNLGFHPSTIELLAGGQTVLLHSMSKAWLSPLVLGVALVPESDLDSFARLFREAPVREDALYEARARLQHDLRFPAQVSKVLNRAELGVRNVLRARGLEHLLPAEDQLTRYLFAVRANADKLLRELDVLAIPLSVFGGDDDYSVISCLAAVGKT
jgi:histidinol-phosphate/aromatic aminotransferase/cobyric acid decarboxylase-like protein